MGKLKTNRSDAGLIPFEFLQGKPLILKKAVQAVHMRTTEGGLSRIQRLMWNAMLKHAREVGAHVDLYSMNRHELAEMIDYSSKNTKHFKESLTQMQRISVIWDVLGQEGSELWASCVLLPVVAMDKENVYYKYSTEVKPDLFNAKIFTRIDLRVQRQFRLDVSAALYEWCVRFRGTGYTCIMPWETWRSCLHGEISEKSFLSQYKHFKQDKLTPALFEINEKSDIEVELREIKEGRFIKELQFLVKGKTLFDPSDENTKRAEKWRERLDGWKLRERDFLDILANYPDNVIEAHYQYTKLRLTDKSKEPLRSPGSYFCRALEHQRAGDMVKREAGTSESTANRANAVLTRFTEQRTREAQGYFKELPADERQRVIQEFNALQAAGEGDELDPEALPTTFRHMLSFYQWLAEKTWGAPSPTEVVQFAMAQGSLNFDTPA